MEIWLDSINIECIKHADKLGILHGITTNPSLVSQSGLSVEDLLEKFLGIQDGQIAVQVVADSVQEIVRQAELLTAHSPRVIVKIPVTNEGLESIYHLSGENIPIMATAVFEPYQALLALKAGAHYIAPYAGRIADFGLNPNTTIRSMQTILDNYKFDSKIIVAGIRDLNTLTYCIENRVAAVTINEQIFRQLIQEHPATAKAISGFNEDWKKAKNSQLLPKK